MQISNEKYDNKNIYFALPLTGSDSPIFEILFALCQVFLTSWSLI